MCMVFMENQAKVLENEIFMRLALEQAKIAGAKGEFPVGCVIVQAGEVVGTGARKGTGPGQVFFNEIDHAEIRALKSLEGNPRKFNSKESVLFCTMEPCLMCFAAIILAGIKKIVYAYEDPMGGGTRCDLSSMTPLYREAKMTIVSGVLREKSLDLFYDFFNKEDNVYWKDSFLEAYTLEQKRSSTRK